MKDNTGGYTCLAIIGNGFDKAHGYKTSYCDFTKHVGEDFFSVYRDFISIYSSANIEWNEFEKQVEALTAAFYQKVMSDEGLDEHVIKHFNMVFRCIKDRLIDYLRTETERNPFIKIESVQNHLDKYTIGLNFNYTNTAENYLCDVIYIHGSLNEKEIVLGYDPADPFCLASYENRMWFKDLCRDRLACERYIKEELLIPYSNPVYQEIFDEYVQIQDWENSGKGLEAEDIASLKHAEFFCRYLQTRCNNDIFKQKNISLNNISKVVVLGHSIKSDKTYLEELLKKCSQLKQVIVFTYKGEDPNCLEARKQFFRPYCISVSDVSY